MKVEFRPLLTVGVTHTYYAGACRDFEFVTPPATANALHGARVLVRDLEGRLHVLWEADVTGAAVNSLAGQTLVFGLRLVNPYFLNVTTPVLPVPPADSDESRLLPFFANVGDPTKLDAPIGVLLTSGIYTHRPKSAARPLTLRLSDNAGALVSQQVLTGAGAADTFDLRGLAEGLYRIDEIVGGAVAGTSRLYVDAQFRDADVWGIIAIQVHAGFYAAAPSLVVSFTARQEQLRYFVVGSNFTTEEFAELRVIDDGFRDVERSEVAFQTVRPSDEIPSEFPPALLADTTTRVVMFRSQVPLVRRERGLRRLQLCRADDVLVENLPQPGVDRLRAEFIIRLTKP